MRKVTANTVVLSILLAPVQAIQATTINEAQAAYERRDYGVAYEILLPMATAGEPQAQVALGILYERGHGVPRDPRMAMTWFTRAAEQDVPAVQHDLAVRHYHGRGTPQNYHEAVRWWRRAARNGSADAAYNLGLMYANGIGLEKDDGAASTWYRQAAEAGHARSGYHLAMNLVGGRGVAADREEAVRWFRHAAERNVAEAQYNLAIMIQRGHVDAAYTGEADDWLRQAAAQGIAEARERLAAGTDEVGGAAAQHPDVASATGRPPGTHDTSAAADPASFVNRHDASSYTLQVLSVGTEARVAGYIADVSALGENCGYLRYRVDGQTHFAALCGVYATQADAQRAIATLPDEIARHKPWARRIGHLRSLAE